MKEIEIEFERILNIFLNLISKSLFRVEYFARYFAKSCSTPKMRDCTFEHDLR